MQSCPAAAHLRKANSQACRNTGWLITFADPNKNWEQQMTIKMKIDSQVLQQQQKNSFSITMQLKARIIKMV